LSASGSGDYGRGAAVLSVGIGVTGLVTYAYFALASHTLSPSAYGAIALLWTVVFGVVSILYRPVEQLLSRTIADRDARGQPGNEHLRVAATIQLALGVLFALVALALRHTLQHGVLGGSRTLYWVMIAAVLFYAASYFARGFLAGHQRFGLYGLLVLLESLSRCMFALVVAVGLFSGQSVVALGIAAAPLVSLAVVPWALRRRIRATAPPEEEPPLTDSTPEQAEFTLARGAGFAAAVLTIMVAEQTFLNAGPLVVKADEGGHAGVVLAGFAFNVLLIARAPLQLFQAIQTSILPHLTRLRASGQADPFRRSINLTLGAIAAFSGAVALAMLALGPQLMRLAFKHGHYPRGGLVVIAVGMGLYLAAATLNQAALARGRTRQAAACWVVSAIAFVLLLVVPSFNERVLQVEVAYAAGAAFLCALLYVLYRRPDAA
jgi:O-antigen/teichoic acid export membrane protein